MRRLFFVSSIVVMGTACGLDTEGLVPIGQSSASTSSSATASSSSSGNNSGGTGGAAVSSSSGLGGSGMGGAGGANGGMGGAGGVASGTGGSNAGGNGGTGGAPSCEEATSADYVIRKKGSGNIILDGNCTEAAWLAAPKIPFQNANVDESDNTRECALLWDGEPSSVVYGCCTFGDNKVEAVQTINDTDGIWDDDAVEFIFDANTDDTRDAQTLKFFINAPGTAYDANFPSDNTNKAHSANMKVNTNIDGMLNQNGMDKGWSVEWSFELPFKPQDESIGKCEFALDDRDDGVRNKTILFGTTINDPAEWGTCKYSCLQATP